MRGSPPDPLQVAADLQRPSQPEIALYAAIMERAVQDLRSPRVTDRRTAAALRDAARAWVAGADGQLRFTDCCQALGINVERVRRQLLHIDVRLQFAAMACPGRSEAMRQRCPGVREL